MPMLVAPLVGVLSDRFGNKPFMLAGLLLQGAGLLWLGLEARLGQHYGALVLPLVASGIGISMVFPTVANAVVGSVPIADSGVAAGANSTVRESGAVFGVAVLAAVFAVKGGYESPAAFMRGFRAAEIVAPVAAVLGAGVAVLAPGKARASDPTPVEVAPEPEPHQV